MKFRLFVFIMILLPFCSPAIAANDNISEEQGTSEVVIEVRESVHVNSRKITLGEIADIKAPAIIKRQLSAIDMGFAPAPGKTKIIDGRQLESKIKSNRLFYGKKTSSNKPSLDKKSSDKAPPNKAPSEKAASNRSCFDNITILVPEEIYVERASQEVSESDLKATYESWVNERLNGKDFEIRDFSVKGLDIYPEGEVELSAPLSNSEDIKGKVTLYVKVRVEGKDYGRISLSGWIDIFDDVLCAARSLTRGKTLEPGDVHVERLNIANLRGDYLNVEQDVIGKVLTRNVPVNKAITPNMIEDAALVHKGDRVKIIAASGNLSIVTIGIIKSDGKMDDTVQVQNMTSGKVINAVVTDKESVKVFY